MNLQLHNYPILSSQPGVSVCAYSPVTRKEN